MRMNFTREFYIPTSYVLLVADKALGLEIYRDPALPVAMAFAGKRAKPDWHYRYASEDRLATKIAEYTESINRYAKAKIEKREAVKKWKHDVKVGDIFRSSWGYEQTNIDYYEVTKLIGAHYAEIREICQERTQTESMQGDCVPVPGKYVTEPDYTAEKVNGVYPRKEIEPRRVRIQGSGTSEPHFKVASYASAYRIKPVAEIAGVKCFAASHWTAYA